MTTFIVVAVLLALCAAALVLVPLVRPRGDGVPPALIAAGVVAVAVLAGSAVLYPTWSTWSWSGHGEGASAADATIGQLARQLERNPDDTDGWMQLGRAYGQVGQYPLAAKAYRRADRLAGGRNADALSGIAESLLLGEQSDLAGEAGHLFEKALEVEPRSIKALFYGALAATERGETDLARTRFRRLLGADTPPDVRRLIEQQIASLDVQEQQVAAAPASGPTLRLQVVIDPAVAGNAKAGAPLFVSVRVAGQPGPPLAAKRLEARFPQEVDLSASDAMIQGRTFEAGQTLEITARIANGGTPTASPGDPVGTLRYSVPKTAPAAGTARSELRIGALTP